MKLNLLLFEAMFKIDIKNQIIVILREKVQNLI